VSRDFWLLDAGVLNSLPYPNSLQKTSCWSRSGAHPPRGVFRHPPINLFFTAASPAFRPRGRNPSLIKWFAGPHSVPTDSHTLPRLHLLCSATGALVNCLDLPSSLICTALRRIVPTWRMLGPQRETTPLFFTSHIPLLFFFNVRALFSHYFSPAVFVSNILLPHHVALQFFFPTFLAVCGHRHKAPSSPSPSLIDLFPWNSSPSCDRIISFPCWSLSPGCNWKSCRRRSSGVVCRDHGVRVSCRVPSNSSCRRWFSAASLSFQVIWRLSKDKAPSLVTWGTPSRPSGKFLFSPLPYFQVRAFTLCWLWASLFTNRGWHSHRCFSSHKLFSSLLIPGGCISLHLRCFWWVSLRPSWGRRLFLVTWSRCRDYWFSWFAGLEAIYPGADLDSDPDLILCGSGTFSFRRFFMPLLFVTFLCEFLALSFPPF